MGIIIDVRVLSSSIAVAWLVLLFGGGFDLLVGVNGEFDYGDALTKSIIFLEAQRSGKLASKDD